MMRRPHWRGVPRMIGVGIFALHIFPALVQAAHPWTPIIGIPQPAFGLNDVPAVPSPWSSPVTDRYYVAGSGGSDTSNTYGTPAAPRATLPSAPAAGAVIFLSGNFTGDRTINWSNGTLASPIWIRSYDTSSRATITSGQWNLSGDNIYFYAINGSGNQQDAWVNMSGDRITVRGCIFSNAHTSSSGDVVNITGTNCLFDGNTVGPSGDYQRDNGLGDIDRHGIKTGGGSDHWIVRSTFFEIQGDGVQLGDANENFGTRSYIGLCTARDTLQNGFWAKDGNDAVISQNTVYNQLGFNADSYGSCIGSQYLNTYVWILCNDVGENSYGGIVLGSEDGGASNTYILGNVIHDTIAHPGWANNNAHSNAAITMRYSTATQIRFNTVWDCHAGIFIPYGGHTLSHNVVSTGSSSGAREMWLDNGTVTLNHNAFEGAAPDLVYNGDVETWASWVASRDTTGIRNIADADFTAVGSDNFSLPNGSDLQDTGGAGAISAFSTFQSRYGISIAQDIIGIARPQNTNWDVGAYEYTPSGSGLSTPGNLSAQTIVILP